MLYDIMPSILEIVDIRIPDIVDGRSLIPLLKGDNRVAREYIHGEHSTCNSEEQKMQYLRDGKSKYIWFPRLGTEQLFDLKEDRYECRNLAGLDQYKDELVKWRKRMVNKFKPRNAGFTKGEKLVSRKGKPYLISPKYNELMEGI